MQSLSVKRSRFTKRLVSSKVTKSKLGLYALIKTWILEVTLVNNPQIAARTPVDDFSLRPALPLAYAVVSHGGFAQTHPAFICSSSSCLPYRHICFDALGCFLSEGSRNHDTGGIPSMDC